MACALALPAGVLAEALCPLPEAQVRSAVRAFSEMSIVFKDRRCTNCHGAVNPFAQDGGHAGGQITLGNTIGALSQSRAALVEALTRANGGRAPSANAIADAEAALRTFRSTDGRLTDRGAIADIIKAGGLESVAYAACAECHTNSMAPWQIATSLWSNKSEEALCEFFQKTMDASAFLQHVTEDPLGFVQAGFAGTRGLTAFGRAFLKSQTGRDYAPEPPKGLSAEGLTAAANRWIEALGGRFHTPPSCGCRIENYRLLIKGTGNLRYSNQYCVHTSNSRSEHSVDLHFDRDGNFQGRSKGLVQINVEDRCTVPRLSQICRIDSTIDEILEVSGAFDKKTGSFALKVSSSGSKRPTAMVCQEGAVTTRTPIGPVPVDPATYEELLPAELNSPKTFESQVEGGALRHEVRIVRR